MLGVPELLSADRQRLVDHKFSKLQNLSVLAKRQVAADGEFGDAVDHGPGAQRHPTQISGRQSFRVLTALDEAEQSAPPRPRNASPVSVLRMNQKAFQIRPAPEAVTSCDYVLGVGKSRMRRVI